VGYLDTKFFRFASEAPLHDYAEATIRAVSADRGENEGPAIPAPHLSVSTMSNNSALTSRATLLLRCRRGSPELSGLSPSALCNALYVLNCFVECCDCYLSVFSGIVSVQLFQLLDELFFKRIVLLSRR
jgi:hypothetical protein